MAFNIGAHINIPYDVCTLEDPDLWSCEFDRQLADIWQCTHQSDIWKANQKYAMSYTQDDTEDTGISEAAVGRLTNNVATVTRTAHKVAIKANRVAKKADKMAKKADRVAKKATSVACRVTKRKRIRHAAKALPQLPQCGLANCASDTPAEHPNHKAELLQADHQVDTEASLIRVQTQVLKYMQKMIRSLHRQIDTLSYSKDALNYLYCSELLLPQADEKENDEVTNNKEQIVCAW